MEDTVRRNSATRISGDRLVYRSAACSHVGTVRKLNEDACLDRGDIGLWAVADGLGGESAGDRASELVVGALARVALAESPTAFLADVRGQLGAVNRLLVLEARESGTNRRMASTVVVLLIYGEHFACAWAGDSRLYLLRRGALQRVSHDHSEVQELVDEGQLDPAAAADHPNANVVTRAVGAIDTLDLDVRGDHVFEGDVFLLCSDGLTKMMTDDEIAALLADRPAKEAVDALIETALQRHANDNVTVVVVKIVRADAKE